jgi:hypothetical protein
VEIQFKMLSNEQPFDDVDKRLELLRQLNQIPGVSLERDAIDRRPAFHSRLSRLLARLRSFALRWSG